MSPSRSAPRFTTQGNCANTFLSKTSLSSVILPQEGTFDVNYTPTSNVSFSEGGYAFHNNARCFTYQFLRTCGWFHTPCVVSLRNSVVAFWATQRPRTCTAT